MDKLPLCLWMLLFPFMDDISLWVCTKWMTHDEMKARHQRSRDAGGLYMFIWAIGTILLYPYHQ